MKGKKMLATFMLVVVISIWAVSANIQHVAAEEAVAIEHDASAGEKGTVIMPAPVQEEDSSGEETIDAGMTVEEALEIARNSECMEEGTLTDHYSYNKDTGTWWIDLEPYNEREGCSPACMVRAATKEAEINWRCTGVLPPGPDQPDGADISRPEGDMPHDSGQDIVIGLDEPGVAENGQAVLGPLEALWQAVVQFFQGIFGWKG